MNLARRAQLLPASELIPSPPKSRTRIRAPRGLVADDREDTVRRGRRIERRRFDCLHLSACETAWCIDHANQGNIGAQAMCPRPCSYYEQKIVQEPVKLDKSLVRIRGAS